MHIYWYAYIHSTLIHKNRKVHKLGSGKREKNSEKKFKTLSWWQGLDFGPTDLFLNTIHTVVNARGRYKGHNSHKYLTNHAKFSLHITSHIQYLLKLAKVLTIGKRRWMFDLIGNIALMIHSLSLKFYYLWGASMFGYLPKYHLCIPLHHYTMIHMS